MQIQWFKKDDGFIDIIVKLLTILGVVFGVWAYFNTVHPMFMKEKQLMNFKTQLQKLKKEEIHLQEDIKRKEEKLKELENNIIEKQALIAAIQKYSDRKEIEVAALQKKVSSLASRLDETRIIAVRAFVIRHMERIADEAINSEFGEKYRKEKNSFDLQKRCLEIAREGLEQTMPGEVENIAFLVLRLFALEKLEPGIQKYNQIIEIMTFTMLDKGALSLIRKKNLEDFLPVPFNLLIFSGF
jgi:type I site-specific restriction endonuclease